jgi:hypothetical protein
MKVSVRHFAIAFHIFIKNRIYVLVLFTLQVTWDFSIGEFNIEIEIRVREFTLPLSGDWTWASLAVAIGLSRPRAGYRPAGDHPAAVCACWQQLAADAPAARLQLEYLTTSSSPAASGGTTDCSD